MKPTQSAYGASTVLTQKNDEHGYVWFEDESGQKQGVYKKYTLSGYEILCQRVANYKDDKQNGWGVYVGYDLNFDSCLYYKHKGVMVVFIWLSKYRL